MGAVNLMGWNEIIMYIIEVILKLIVAAAIPYAFAKVNSVIHSKIQNETVDRYLDRFEQLVKDAVDQVQQTYVVDMKAENLFDKEAQFEALGRVKANVLSMMNSRMQEIVFDAVGDFDDYLTNKIEAEVFRLKSNEYKKGVLLNTAEVDAE